MTLPSQPTSPSVDGETLLRKVMVAAEVLSAAMVDSEANGADYEMVDVPWQHLTAAIQEVYALSLSEAPVAWQYRYQRWNNLWSDWSQPQFDKHREADNEFEWRPLYAAPSPAIDPATVEALIKHMRDRFLGWKLPEDFKPDAGISFTRQWNMISGIPFPMPTGTNLFDATQADAMVRHMIEGFDRALTGKDGA